MPRGVSRYDEARLQGRLWTPLNAGPPKVWLDASDISTLTVSAGVCSAFVNKKGALSNGGSGTMNWSPVSWPGDKSKPCFNQLGSPSNSFSLTNSVNYSGSTGLTALSLSWVPVTAGTYPDGYWALVNGPSGCFYWRNEGANINVTRQSVLSLGGTTSDWTTNFKLGSYRARTSENRISCNGSADVNDTTDPGFTSGTTALYGDGFGNGGIAAEQIIWEYALSIPDLLRAEGYLAWKWGVQRYMAAKHPYKNRPPLIGA